MAISDNLRGALYMNLSMFAFTVNDTFMKAVTQTLPLYQTIALRGLIAVLHALYSGLPVAAVGKVDAVAELGRLGLNDHLSAQRSNGVRAMVERIRKVAAEA